MSANPHISDRAHEGRHRLMNVACEASGAGRKGDDGSTVEPARTPNAPPADDYDPEGEVAADIEVITHACRAWIDADEGSTAAGARSTAACHIALGEIFARSGPTDEDEEKLRALIDRVKEHPEVRDSRYNPFDHNAAELHLTLQFGVKLRRGAKANWKKAVQAAEIVLANGTITERSVDAFAGWFRNVGMKGAREIVDGSPGDKAEAKIAAIADMPGMPFELPAELQAIAKAAHGTAVMLLRLSDDQAGGTNAEALGLDLSRSLVAATWANISRKAKQDQKLFERDCIDALERRDTDDCPAYLRIPEHRRKHFDGRTHYTDEDERNEFERERKLELKRRRKAGRWKLPKTQEELARKGKGKARIPEELLRGSTAVDAPEGSAPGPVADLEASADETRPADSTFTAKSDVLEDEDDDDIDYFAKLREVH